MITYFLIGLLFIMSIVILPYGLGWLVLELTEDNDDAPFFAVWVIGLGVIIASLVILEVLTGLGKLISHIIERV